MQIDSSKAVTRSFASGTVSAKNASSGAGAWAGGVVGYEVSGQLSQCVAAGRSGRQVSVSAQGGNASRFANRVYGATAGTAPANNYARDIMYTGTSTVYTTNPALDVVSGTPTAASADGANAANASLSTTTSASPGVFWPAGSSLNFNGANSVWNFGPISQGWPLLAGLGGQ